MDLNKMNVAGSLWLNLSNTNFYSNGTKMDVLVSRDLALQWLKVNELIHKNSSFIVGELFLTRLRELRTVIQNLLKSIENEGKISEVVIFELNSILKHLSIRYKLIVTEDSLQDTFFAEEIEENILFRIIESINESLTNYPLTRIKQCSHEDCILHFLDTSKAGKRKWCTMDTCGNRVKANRHYKRRKEESY